MRGYVSHRDDEVETFARAVLLDLDAAGALADFLDERDPPTAPYLSGRPSPSRGTLLRRRWQQWRFDRGRAKEILYHVFRAMFPYSMTVSEVWTMCDEEKVARRKSIIDQAFIEYIRSRFIVPVRTS